MMQKTLYSSNTAGTVLYQQHKKCKFGDKINGDQEEVGCN
jgi:hypothetical protein